MRTSYIGQVEGVYIIHLYEDGELVEVRPVPNKSLRYAEDVSENWDTGLIKINK
jgi:hypothetical protein